MTAAPPRCWEPPSPLVGGTHCDFWKQEPSSPAQLQSLASGLYGWGGQERVDGERERARLVLRPEIHFTAASKLNSLQSGSLFALLPGLDSPRQGRVQRAQRKEREKERSIKGQEKYTGFNPWLHWLQEGPHLALSHAALTSLFSDWRVQSGHSFSVGRSGSALSQERKFMACRTMAVL